MCVCLIDGSAQWSLLVRVKSTMTMCVMFVIQSSLLSIVVRRAADGQMDRNSSGGAAGLHTAASCCRFGPCSWCQSANGRTEALCCCLLLLLLLLAVVFHWITGSCTRPHIPGATNRYGDPFLIRSVVGPCPGQNGRKFVSLLWQ